MENQNHADVSSQPASIDLDNAVSPILPVPNETQQADDKVNAFMKFAYEKMTNERDQLQNQNIVLEFQILKLKEALENHTVALDDGSKRAYEDEINRLNQRVAELEASNKNYVEMISGLKKQQESDQKEKNDFQALDACFQPLVCKKLLINGDQKNWHCYTTFNENEEPMNLSYVNLDLVINGAISQNQLILEGIISQYEGHPFHGNAQGLCYSQLDVSYLLPKVLSCNVTDLFLYNQNLHASELEKLISFGLIKNLYLCNIQIYLLNLKQPVFTYLDGILEKLPNIERAAFLSMKCYSKETFKKLAKLPPFKKLRELKLDGISYPDFREDVLHGFMKKHPDTRISLSFIASGNAHSIQSQFEHMKYILQSQARHYNVNLEMEML